MCALTAVSPTAAVQSDPPQRHVLVVDDEVELADQLAQGLRILGFAVASVYSATEARRQLAARGDIEVVITDVRLAGEEGLELAEEISRETDERRAIEVVVISGNASTEDAARAERAGASDFLTKPFRLHEIAKAVDVAAARARARRMQAHSLSNGAQPSASLLARLETTNAALAAKIASGAMPPEITPCLAEILPRLKAASGFQDLHELEAGVLRLEELLHAFALKAPGTQTALDLAPLATGVLNRVAQAHPSCALRIDQALPEVAILADRERVARIVELSAGLLLAHPSHNTTLGMGLSTDGSTDAKWARLGLWAGPDAMANEPSAGLMMDGQPGAIVKCGVALGFFLARRLAKLEGGALSRTVTSTGHVALQLSLPVRPVK